MPSWLIKLTAWLRSSKAAIVCDASIWRAGVAELRRRTRSGRRESGAFLLGVQDGSSKRVLEFVFYDDIDPHALDTGIVHFSGSRLPKLWEHCRKRGYGVVADVHVHPGAYGQSESEQADPVMPRAGHIAVIIPDFAAKGTEPGAIGLYEYRGEGVWHNQSRRGEKYFRLEAKR
jgi:hypothetical protein